MDFRISQELRDLILDYLVTRPYREVASGVAALAALEPVDRVSEPTINPPTTN